MQYKGHPLRHELKYLINYTDYNALANAISAFMPPDEHSGDGGYFIRSLYFDDIYGSAYEEKDAGILRRRKHRVRIYDLSDAIIKFEIKDKFDNSISKMSASISKQQFYEMLYGNYDFMLDSAERALRVGFIDARLKQLSPCVVVDYLREAFVGEEGNVRITFDRNLRAGFSGFDVFDRSLPTLPAMDSRSLILEVKYDDFIPNHIKKLLAPLNSRQTSLSKFVMCRDAQCTYYRKESPNGSF